MQTEARAVDPSPQSDEVLFTRWVASRQCPDASPPPGDGAALRILWEKHRSRTERLVGRLAGHGRSEVAEQALFMTWREVLRARDWREGNFAGWINAVARRKVIDALRQRCPAPQVDLDALPSHPPADGPPVDEVLVREDLILKLRQALRGLSAADRKIAELSWVEGRTRVEVAAALDMPVGSVKSRVAAILKALRQELDITAPQRGGAGRRGHVRAAPVEVQP